MSVREMPAEVCGASSSSGNGEVRDPLAPLDSFPRRHIGPDEQAVAEMLKTLDVKSLDALIADTVPPAIRLNKPLDLPAALGESAALAALKAIAQKNKVYKSFIGMGYYGTITPPVILRNILENPGWYTAYTPYQAEIAQGRLEALLNFQTMVCDLTGLPLANSSMLDEATAAAEAMNMCHSLHEDRPRFFVAEDCHPQTIAVVKTRAKWLGIEITIGDPLELINATKHNGAPDGNPGAASLEKYCGVLVQYPTTDGRIADYGPLTVAAHKHNTQIVAAVDLLALTLIKPPGEWDGGGADIAVGSAQRFGVPMGAGGPHAAFMACKTEYTRKLPGRIVGVSKDVHGDVAYRLAIQTREQHIRREKATSNICTAQVLLAIMASMYAVYHGPEGLKAIARRVHGLTTWLMCELIDRRVIVFNEFYFDTLLIRLPGSKARAVLERARTVGVNLRAIDEDKIAISVDESTTQEDIEAMLKLFGTGEGSAERVLELHRKFVRSDETPGLPSGAPLASKFARKSPFLTHPVFNLYHSEHEMLRYMKRLEAKDLSLTTSMIPLGSCTMKLNATAEMLPVTWPEFGNMHPFAPAEQMAGYAELFETLEGYLAEITGFDAVSLQPNAGSQGEYAGLLAIRAYHEAQMNAECGMRNAESNAAPSLAHSAFNIPHSPRDICLIPTSAHGTNPASAVVAGLKVVAVACDAAGNIDVGDLKKKAADHAANLACIMITYPSTHGVFEESVREICEIVHAAGGQVYMDGANMNAQVGLTSPGFIGADVCHLNLHKTFCIPHGGGGPGMGPIACKKHLAAFLPAKMNAECGMRNAESGAASSLPHSAFRIPHSFPTVVSAAPFGSASILTISWMYIRMMGEAGLKRATEVAILNANYMARRLEGHYPIMYRGKHGHCAHEFILDCRQFEQAAGVKVEDIAKRLMDYGFHAPTMSWPVPGTLMFEPTESESKAELDRLCDAMIAIRGEIRAIEEGQAGAGDKSDNLLKNAPHTAAHLTADTWPHAYSRQLAAYPAPWTRLHKYWPPVGRIDNPYGDRNLVCSCPPV